MNQANQRPITTKTTRPGVNPKSTSKYKGVSATESVKKIPDNKSSKNITYLNENNVKNKEHIREDIVITDDNHYDDRADADKSNKQNKEYRESVRSHMRNFFREVIKTDAFLQFLKKNLLLSKKIINYISKLS
eukprot:CAMPEP_0170519906 /NCGR_PEP_ID=MMETSP0209-20121228/5142_1 /TAXON_ID=665100 ORGANISM="Litonotus pictus, Strain P1" /NCGR_SAMPLE_ID=MMETSP0209 /ASSEMBLY_ACC=CAM_ASM_000301 /LENGTH=132 /DNA_ID=CAMNT_0010805895 /DNA_START=3215 /DNA_END=3613 /DNA_ORIENTATION=+